MNPVAAANTVSGEKTTCTITFPLTDDIETDSISGMLEVLRATRLIDNFGCSLRVCQYLMERFKQRYEEEQRQRSQWSEMQKAAGQIGAAQATPPSINPLAYPVWTDSTTGRPSYSSNEQLREQLGLPKP